MITEVKDEHQDSTVMKQDSTQQPSKTDVSGTGTSEETLEASTSSKKDVTTEYDDEDDNLLCLCRCCGSCVFSCIRSVSRVHTD